MSRLAITISCLVLFCASGNLWAAPKGMKTLEIGQAVPDFALPGVDGKTHCLKDFADA